MRTNMWMDGWMDGHGKFHRCSAGTPTHQEMPQKFNQAHDFNTRGLQDNLSLTT